MGDQDEWSTVMAEYVPSKVVRPSSRNHKIDSGIVFEESKKYSLVDSCVNFAITSCVVSD